MLHDTGIWILGCELDLAGGGWVTVVGACEYGTRPLGSITGSAV